MSRQPAADKKESLQALLSMANVVDFVDNTVVGGAAASTLNAAAPAAPHAGVMPGPPSYLQAHGIKYVPAVTAGRPDCGLDSEFGDPMDPSGGVDATMVPMAQNAQARQRVVTQAELNERANQQVANYMRGGAGISAQQGVPAGRDPVLDRLRSLQADMDRMATRAPSGGRVGSHADVSERIQELRSRIGGRVPRGGGCAAPDYDW